MKSLDQRREMIERDISLSLSTQCLLLSIWRSGLYYKPRRESEENLVIMRWMDEQYFKTPFYGLRKLRDALQRQGYLIAKTRVRRLMNLTGWQTIYRKPRLSLRNKQHPVYPYLLKDYKITHANQVWAIDITYVPMRRGFLYLCAIIDLHTRYVIHWSLNNTMEANWCRCVVEDAIAMHGQPEIINSDQGSQFTSEEYTSLLLNRDKPIAISMDGKGRAIDNIFIERLWRSVKYECVYLHAFDDGVRLYEGLKSYFHFYNQERSHESLGYDTPASHYPTAA
jgi:putative transposase